MANNIQISEKSKSILYEYPQIKRRNDMSYTELRKYTDDWQTFDRVWMYDYTVRDLLKSGANVSYYVYENDTERKSYRAGQTSHMSMYPEAAAKGVFNDVPHTIPDTPTWNTLSGNNASVELTWNIPPSNESPIISYIITSYDESNNTITNVVSGSTNSFIFTGLTNGLSYRFRIFSKNDIGDSPISDYSNSVIPTTFPEQPTGFSVLQGDAKFYVQWIVPFNGGSAITSYNLILYDENNNPIKDESDNPIQNIITNADLSGAKVLNTPEGFLVITDSDKQFTPYEIGDPIQSRLVIGNSYSFILTISNSLGESPDITILKSPVRFIRTPQNAPVWVATNNAVYNALMQKLTFTFTQTAEDRNITSSYQFMSTPEAIDRSVPVENTTSTNVGERIQVVAFITNLPSNTFTFRVYAFNRATTEDNKKISDPSSPVIVSRL
jgi:hypothetical protein